METRNPRVWHFEGTPQRAKQDYHSRGPYFVWQHTSTRSEHRILSLKQGRHPAMLPVATYYPVLPGRSPTGVAEYLL